MTHTETQGPRGSPLIGPRRKENRITSTQHRRTQGGLGGRWPCFVSAHFSKLAPLVQTAAGSLNAGVRVLLLLVLLQVFRYRTLSVYFIAAKQ